MGRDARGGRLRDGSAGRRALPRGEFPGLPDGRRAACARARLSAADHDSRQVRDEAAEVAYRDKPGGTEFVGYWERRGWSQSAWRKVNSGFFYPRTPHSSLLRLISPVPRLRAPVDI